MSTLVSPNIKHIARHFRRSATHSRPAPIALDEFLAEPEMLRLVSRERQRSERTGRPFLLMLLDCAALRPWSEYDGAWRKAAAAVGASMRSTDSFGWYHQRGVVIGAVFTELATPVAETVRMLNERVVATLSEHLPPEQAKRVQVDLYTFPEAPVTGSGPSDLTFYPDLTRNSWKKKASRGVKRALDIAGSLFLLTLLSPLLLGIALAVKLTSKGPALFKQKRVGQYGKEFVFLKFRSMYVGNDPSLHRDYVMKFIAGSKDAVKADESGQTLFKIQNDPRVTPLGRILRKTSLDEFPQFLNVLLGDMSLVGPRPPLPYETAAYQSWHRRRILGAKPGITGLWQVMGRSRLTFDEMVRLDLQYVRESSFLLDLKILARTPSAVLSGNGAH